MSLARQNSMSAAAFLHEPDFARLKRAVIETIGLQYYEDKDESLAERAEQRRLAVGCGRTEYLRRVLDPRNTEELAALVDEITIGETYFFRYPQQFEAMRQVVLPERLAWRQPDRSLRVWSAGCASGAEPYSVAITLRQHFAATTEGWHLSILGTDVNRKVLAQARSGDYSEWELRGDTAELKSSCFTGSRGRWTLRPEYREHVEFRHQNLVTDIDAFVDNHRGLFDIIFCRNVMIYFSPALIRRLIRRLSDCLVDGGWLFVGHAEPYFEIANLLTPVSLEGVTLYRRSVEPAPAGRHRFTLPFDEPAPPPPPTWPDPPASTWLREVPPAPPPVTPSPAPSTLERIRKHADAGEWPDALAACAQALEQAPMDAAVHYVQGLIYEHIAAPAAAEESLSRAIYLDRNLALAHFHAGLCQTRRGDRRAAQRSFHNVLRILEPQQPDAEVSLGDGLTAGELRELTELQLATSGSA